MTKSNLKNVQRWIYFLIHCPHRAKLQGGRNIFRNYASARIMQLQGIRVIPNIPVCKPRLYNKVFDPLEGGGIYAISNVRAHANYFTRHEWYRFVREAIRRLNPNALLIYGNKMTVAGVKAYYYDNDNIIRLRHGK